jgi:hypothetical protein
MFYKTLLKLKNHRFVIYNVINSELNDSIQIIDAVVNVDVSVWRELVMDGQTVTAAARLDAGSLGRPENNPARFLFAQTEGRVARTAVPEATF